MKENQKNLLLVEHTYEYSYIWACTTRNFVYKFALLWHYLSIRILWIIIYLIFWYKPIARVKYKYNTISSFNVNKLHNQIINKILVLVPKMKSLAQSYWYYAYYIKRNVVVPSLGY